MTRFFGFRSILTPELFIVSGCMFWMWRMAGSFWRKSYKWAMRGRSSEQSRIPWQGLCGVGWRIDICGLSSISAWTLAAPVFWLTIIRGHAAVQPLNFQQPRSCKSLSNVWTWRLGIYCREIPAKRWRFDMWQLNIHIKDIKCSSSTWIQQVSARKLGWSPRRSSVVLFVLWSRSQRRWLEGHVTDVSQTAWNLQCFWKGLANKAVTPFWFEVWSCWRCGTACSHWHRIPDETLTPRIFLCRHWNQSCSPEEQDLIDLRAWVCNQWLISWCSKSARLSATSWSWQN